MGQVGGEGMRCVFCGMYGITVFEQESGVVSLCQGCHEFWSFGEFGFYRVIGQDVVKNEVVVGCLLVFGEEMA